MDETLFDFRRVEEINLLTTLKKFGIDADRRIWQRFHEINKSLWEEFERGKISKDGIKLGRFEKLFSEYGYSAPVSEVAEAFFENFKEICIPFEGAEKFLRELALLGRIFVVTNGNPVIQRRHLTDAGFLPLIAGAFISDEIGYAKPSKEFADFVTSHIEGFERERTVWIGDSLTADRECARVAGVDFILFEHNYDEILASLKGGL